MEIKVNGVKEEGVTYISQRGLEVAKLIAKGLTNKEIGTELGITERTVQSHITNILATLKIENRTQLVIALIKYKLIKVEEL